MTTEEKPKKKRKKRGLGGSAAELLVQSWLEKNEWIVHRAIRGGFTRFQKKGGGFGSFTKSFDLFGCLDLIAIKAEEIPETWGIQVTTNSGLAERRKKIAAIGWPYSWRLSIVTHERVEDPARRNRSLHFLKIQDFINQKWLEPNAVQIDPQALEDFRRQRREAEKAQGELVERAQESG